MKNHFRQLFTYSLVGAVGTAAHYAVLLILVELVEVNPVIATTYGFIVGAITNYILNYYLTFKSKKAHVEALTKFLLVATVGAAINSLIMYIGTETLAFHYLLAQVTATALVLLWSYLVNKHWTF